MISFLIPTYHYNCSALVLDLHAQATRLGIPFEIIVSDDATKEAMITKRLRNDVQNKAHVHLQKNNIGRAANRNFLADHALYDALVFIDGDSSIHPDFVRTYFQHLEDINKSIICGGTSLHQNIDTSKYLHRKYSLKREFKSEAFQSNNFLISRKNFHLIRFDESITTYGHEDTLFGIMANSMDIKIIRIENPVVHSHLETSSAFLHKQKQASYTLADLHLANKIRSTKIIDAYIKMNKWGISKFFISSFPKFDNLIWKNLQGNNPNLLLLDIYKLYHFSVRMSEVR